ncbi:MAG: DNA double-strand break repair nuclease NurA [Candidatus Melainabacteria bacterium]|jgi:hypothetical protein
MLNREKVIKAIKDKSLLMKSMQDQAFKSLEIFTKQLKEISEHFTPESFNEKVLASKEKFAGALATQEFAKGLIHHSIDRPINSAEEANQWKSDVLSDRIVVAVDGSQIEPDKNLNLFLGAVQVGWFVNFHNGEIPPIKELDFDLIVPSSNALLEEQEFRQEIAFQRFKKEAQKLIEQMNELSVLSNNLSMSKRPIAFFDGSLTLSFVQSESRKRSYLQVVSELIEASERNQIPLIGYIDTSLAFNIIKSIEQAFQMVSSGRISDSGLLNNILTNWGMRSAYFQYFDRGFDAVAGEANVMSKIGFCYLKAASGKRPVRLEIPTWVYHAGLLDETVDVVIAQCLVGNGYPYVIEVADSIAVIQNAERELFYKYLEQNAGLELNTSKKQKSKNARRKPTLIV